MAFTQLEQIKLEIGIEMNDPLPIMSDEELQYFLDKNGGSIRKSSLDAARAILFRLASFTNEEVDVLAYRGSDYFKQYAEALKLYIKNPEFGAVTQAMGYVGGVSLVDIEQNIRNPDNNYVRVQRAVPIGNDAINVNNDSPFSTESLPRPNNPFSV